MVEGGEGKENEGTDAHVLTSGILLQLYEHYKSELRSDLEFTYKYLNFYVGLNSALLAATIAGLLRQAEGDKKGLLLLFGPLLIIGLTLNGYRTIRVFYRRFIEAWITSVNIESMLTLGGVVNLEKGIQKPRFKSSSGSFIMQYERATIRNVLEQAEDKGWTAEITVKRVAAKGDTLRFARFTFLLFAIAGFALGVVSVMHAFLPTEPAFLPLRVVSGNEVIGVLANSGRWLPMVNVSGIRRPLASPRILRPKLVIKKNTECMVTSTARHRVRCLGD
jgi:hypothetical protein